MYLNSKKKTVCIRLKIFLSPRGISGVWASDAKKIPNFIWVSTFRNHLHSFYCPRMDARSRWVDTRKAFSVNHDHSPGQTLRPNPNQTLFRWRLWKRKIIHYYLMERDNNVSYLFTNDTNFLPQMFFHKSKQRKSVIWWAQRHLQIKFDRLRST